MHRFKKSFVIASIVPAFLALAQSAKAVTIYGVDGQGANQKLITVDSSNPAVLTSNLTLTGLVSNELLGQLDFRPSTGQLYGLATRHLYTINTTTGVATPVGSAFTTSFNTEGGFDFNPVTDKISFVVNDTQFNDVIDPDTGVVTQKTNVAYAAGDVHAGQTPRIGGTAFSNNFAGATSTTMYDLDLAGGIATLATQNFDSGTLTTIGSTGSAGSTNGTPADLDISSDGIAFADAQSFFDAGNTILFSVNLATGHLTNTGVIGGSQNFLNVRDIAIPITAVPEPTTLSLCGIAFTTLLAKRRRS